MARSYAVKIATDYDRYYLLVTSNNPAEAVAMIQASELPKRPRVHWDIILNTNPDIPFCHTDYNVFATPYITPEITPAKVKVVTPYPALDKYEFASQEGALYFIEDNFPLASYREEYYNGLTYYVIPTEDDNDTPDISAHNCPRYLNT